MIKQYTALIKSCQYFIFIGGKEHLWDFDVGCKKESWNCKHESVIPAVNLNFEADLL